MGFEYYQHPMSVPFPRSRATALRAFRNGQVGIEPAIYWAGSVDSIYRRPLAVHLVLELLSRSRLEAEINTPIARVLFDSLEHPDREIADFAAQTLARLEERYYREMRRLEPLPDKKTELAQLYFDFAELQSFNRTLRRYYLNKCDETIKSVAADGADHADRADEAVPFDLLMIQARSRLALGLIEDTAATITDNLGAARRRAIDDPKGTIRQVVGWLLLKAELAWSQFDLRGVYAVVEELAALPIGDESLRAQVDEVVEHWRSLRV